MAIKTKVKRSLGSDVIELNAAFTDYLEEKEAKNLSEATIRSYTESYERFCSFFEFDSSTTTDEVTQQSVFKWIGTMKLEGLSYSSINHYLRDIRAFLYWCMDDVRKYIAPSFKVQLLVGQEEPPKAFKEEDINALIEKPGKREGFTAWRTWAIVNWILGTGSRASTIVDVKMEDIDFREKMVRLRHTKNKKAQEIPLSSSLETAIKEYIRIWRKDSPEDSYLFCNIGDEQLTTNALRQSLAKYCADRGVSQHNIHGLRHNFAISWVKNGGNMFALQKILGHATLDMTKKYVRLYGEDLKDDFDKFNPLDNIKRKAKRTQTVKRSY